MTDHDRRAMLVWLTDIAESPVGFRDQYSGEEEKKLAGYALQLIEDYTDALANRTLGRMGNVEGQQIMVSEDVDIR